MVYNSAAAAHSINLIDDADSRKAEVYWLDHMAHTISGADEELAYFYEQILEIAEPENNGLLIASAFADMFFIDSTMNEGAESEKYSKQCLKHLENLIANNSSKLNDSNDETADILSDIAFIYFEIECYSKAVEYYLQYKKILISLGDDAKIMLADSRIADCYRRLNDYEKSCEYYEKSFEYAVKSLGEEHPTTGEIYSEYSIDIVEEYKQDQGQKSSVQA